MYVRTPQLLLQRGVLVVKVLFQGLQHAELGLRGARLVGLAHLFVWCRWWW
jgi:hypothetical protein